MPADLALTIRTAGTWDTARLIDAMTPALEQTALAWWLQPAPARRAPSVRDHLRHLAGHTGGRVVFRVVERDGEILAGAAWTTCTDGAHPPGLLLPGDTAEPRRAAHLDARLAEVHPADAHRHLLLLAVKPGRQRRGLGSALLADTGPDGPPMPSYTVLIPSLIAAAAHAGYHSTGLPVGITAAITLQPLRREPSPPQ
ncbi:hypothetical protein Ari01nite_85720 [Paractinoplanes rishiriensis]|uniref:Uncharacterized protein n=2 Tax=Paractinoplanes rishiriensis TaxID=1050105 RepID=A0A919N2N8_9ACTN|nr:hypothetical protein Ari01nite_85720 [Actinoplanes rishiriensis]